MKNYKISEYHVKIIEGLITSMNEAEQVYEEGKKDYFENYPVVIGRLSGKNLYHLCALQTLLILIKHEEIENK